MSWIGIALVTGYVIYFVITRRHLTAKNQEFYYRTGRISLWLLFPPLGFWRSWKHGQRKHDEEFVRLLREAKRGEDLAGG